MLDVARWGWERDVQAQYEREQRERERQEQVLEQQRLALLARERTQRTPKEQIEQDPRRIAWEQKQAARRKKKEERERLRQEELMCAQLATALATLKKQQQAKQQAELSARAQRAKERHPILAGIIKCCCVAEPLSCCCGMLTGCLCHTCQVGVGFFQDHIVDAISPWPTPHDALPSPSHEANLNLSAACGAAACLGCYCYLCYLHYQRQAQQSALSSKME